MRLLHALVRLPHLLMCISHAPRSVRLHRVHTLSTLTNTFFYEAAHGLVLLLEPLHAQTQRTRAQSLFLLRGGERGEVFFCLGWGADAEGGGRGGGSG
jgi:hypothetical protein